MISVGDLLAVLRLRDEMSPALNQAAQNVTQFGGGTSTAAYQLTLLGRGFREAGVLMSSAFTVPIVAATAATFKFGGEFEAATTRLVSLAGVSKEELGGVRDRILELGPATGIGPNALAEAMYKVSSTTRDTSVGLEILEVAAMGSAAGMGDAKDVAGALTAVINSYGSSNIDAAKAGDILTRAVRDGGAEAKELAPTLANVVPFAAQLGISFEEVAANIATVTKVGVPASEAVTSLASVFAALARETKRGEDALKTVNMSYAQLRAEIKEKGLAATLLELKDAFKGQEHNLIDVVGRLEALKNILSVTGAQAKTYTEEVQRMASATGELRTAFEQITPTQEFMWNQLKAGIEGTFISLSVSLMPVFKKTLELLNGFIPIINSVVKSFGELSSTTQLVVIAFFALLAATGPLLIAFGSLLQAFGNIARGFPIVIGLWQAFTNSVAMNTIGVWALNAASTTAGTVLLGLAHVLGFLIAVWAGWKIGPMIGDWIGISDHIEYASLKLQRWLGLVDQAATDQDLWNSVQENTKRRAGEVGPALDANAEALKRLKDQISGVGLIKDMQDLQTVMRELGEAGKLPPEVLERIAKQAQLLQAQGQKLTPELQRVVDAFGKVTEAGNENIASIREQAEALKRYNKAVKDNIDEDLRLEAERWKTKAYFLDFNGERAIAEVERQYKVMEKAHLDFIESEHKAWIDYANWLDQTGLRGIENAVERYKEVWSHSSAAQQAHANDAKRIYDEMLAYSDKFSAETLAKFKKMWQDAQHLADGTRNWRDNLDLVVGALEVVGDKWATMTAGVLRNLKAIIDIWGSGVKNAHTLAFGQMLGMLAEFIPASDKAAVSAAKFAMQGAAVGSVFGPWGAAIGAGVGAVYGWIKAGQEARKTNDLRDAFIAARGGLDVLHASLVKILGPTGELITQHLLAAKNTKEWEAATKELDATLKHHQEQMNEVVEMIKKLGTNFSAIAKAIIPETKEQLRDLGIIAVASINAALEAGYSLREAIQMNHDGIQELIEAYKRLKIPVDDAFLNMLMIVDQVIAKNPTLVAGIDALISSMDILAKLGMLNKDTFDAMQRSAYDMYVQLQAQVASFGGTTKDALLLMQDLLHKAEQRAKELGIPLDANLQMLIDQSKELGIWEDIGKTANEKLLEGLSALVNKMNELVDAIRRAGDGMRNIPPPPPAPNYPSPDEPPPSEQAFGGEYIVSRPTMFLAGETGRPERVHFGEAAKGGGGVSKQTELKLDKVASEVEGLRRDFQFTIPNLLAKATMSAMAKA